MTTQYNGPRQLHDMELLKAALRQYGEQQFNQEFGFEYYGDNTKPPNAAGKSIGCARFLDFGEYPPSDQTVSERVGVELFQYNNLLSVEPLLTRSLLGLMVLSFRMHLSKVRH